MPYEPFQLKNEPKLIHAFPICKEKGFISIVAFCGAYSEKEPLEDQSKTPENACPICKAMHELRETF